VEPAATNLILRSEEFDLSPWGVVNTTITPNNFTAPNGTLTADQMNIADSNSRVAQTFSLGATTVTFSVYLYSAVSFTLRIVALFDGSSIGRNITIPAGQWTRFAETFTSITSFTGIQIRGLSGGSTGDIYLWGAQLETGSVATSYIPTVAATATRNADVISKTGVSGFIGQTEGWLYAEINVDKLLGIQSRYILNISDGTADNRIYLAFSGASSNILRARVWSGGVLQATIDTTTISTLGIRKLAIGYANNDVVFYMNGVQIGTDNSASIPACSQVNLGSSQGNLAQINDRIRAAAIGMTRISNAELAAMTEL
jgi:hypothetical protein